MLHDNMTIIHTSHKESIFYRIGAYNNKHHDDDDDDLDVV